MAFAPSDRRFLLFRHGGEEFALPIGAVEEIILPRPLVPVPLVPGFIEGVVNLRGRVVTMVRLAGLPGLPPAAGEPSVSVILRLPEAALAFGAEEVLGIEELDPEGTGRPAAGGTGPVRGVVQQDGRAVNLLDPGLLQEYVLSYDYQAGVGARRGEGRV